MSVKGQSRQYTAVIDPSSAKAKAALAAEKKGNAAQQNKAEQAKKDKAAKEEAARLEKEARAKKKEAERLEKAARAEQEKAERLEREARAKAEKAEAKAEKEQQAQDRRSGNRIYTVQPEETLFIIADKLRPDNMSADQAVRALVKANPKKLGGNPNRLFAGVTLNLPAGFKTQSESSSGTAAGADKMPAPAEERPAADTETSGSAQENATPQTDGTEEGQDGAEQQPASVETEPAPPAQIAPQAQQPAEADEEESDGSLWKWLLAGGLALTIAFLVFKLVREGRFGRKAAPAA
ncbi:LysM peptidoglycan-binding domain-containing protein [Kingella potus]|nr:LysM peptidoglycan-binding domain-containing protein [Kingella potus]UOP00311.1 LysM peptidoglycan-binding domain-containing protein [Kingella potus]